jgi:hypothetical protein
MCQTFNGTGTGLQSEYPWAQHDGCSPQPVTCSSSSCCAAKWQLRRLVAGRRGKLGLGVVAYTAPLDHQLTT